MPLVQERLCRLCGLLAELHYGASDPGARRYCKQIPPLYLHYPVRIMLRNNFSSIVIRIMKIPRYAGIDEKLRVI